MFDLCINLLRESVDYVIKHKDMNVNNRLRVSVLLDEVSKILEDTATKLSKDEYPHMNCALMEKMTNHIEFFLDGKIPQNLLEQLHKSLIESSQVEIQFANRGNDGVIESIFNASAEFKTISMLLKV
jgi:hypothetical protein